jgi:hypothetical protein
MALAKIETTEFVVTCSKCGNPNDESNLDCKFGLCLNCCYTSGEMAFCHSHLRPMDFCPCCPRITPHFCPDGKNCDDCDGSICVSCCIDGKGSFLSSNAIVYATPDP